MEGVYHFHTWIADFIVASKCHTLHHCLRINNMTSMENLSQSMSLAFTPSISLANCGIRHVTVPIATSILIANVRHIGLSNICVINLVYFKMQV